MLQRDVEDIYNIIVILWQCSVNNPRLQSKYCKYSYWCNSNGLSYLVDAESNIQVQTHITFKTLLLKNVKDLFALC